MNIFELNPKILKKLLIYKNDNYKLSKYGIINKKKYKVIPELYFLKESSCAKLNIIYYYLKHTNFQIIHYKNNIDNNIKDNTLKYALSAVGTIQSVYFDENEILYKIHINDEFIHKNNGLYDNNKFCGFALLDLLWWIIYIIDMCTLLYIKYKNKLINKIIYINTFDNPIFRKDKQHPHEFLRNNINKIKIPITTFPDNKYPIFSFSSHKDYNDIELPIPDLWMFMYNREHSVNYNINNYKLLNIDFSNKLINKAIFRGGINSRFIDENIFDSIRMKAHIKHLCNINYIDAIILPSVPYISNNNNILLQDSQSDLKLFDNNYRMDVIDQLKYRYILHLDGYSSAWRIIKELFYHSIILIPDTDFTDIVRNLMIPWVHYIPIKKNLSNLVNTIKWCNNNINEIIIIANNALKLGKFLCNINLNIDYIYNCITTNNKCNYNHDIEWKILKTIPIISDDDNIIINKNIIIKFKNIYNNNIIIKKYIV